MMVRSYVSHFVYLALSEQCRELPRGNLAEVHWPTLEVYGCHGEVLKEGKT